MKIFDLTDSPSPAEREALGWEAGDGTRIRAQLTGQYRPPRKGEWYLSGAIAEAYRACHDWKHGDDFHILKLVRVRKVESWEVVQ